MTGSAFTQPLLGQHYRHLSVFQHDIQALLRICRIQRQVRSTRLEDTQQPYHHLQRPLHTDSNQHLRAHTQGSQVMRQLIRSSIQLPIGEVLAFENDRDTIWSPLDLSLKKLMNTTLWVVCRCIVPLNQHLAPLGVCQKRQFRDSPLRMRHHTIQ